MNNNRNNFLQFIKVRSLSGTTLTGKQRKL